MPTLELRHFRAVMALRDCQTTIAAAEVLGLTQSAVSHQLSEAERRLGRKLFVRSGRLLHLNTAGELLASSAERILAEVDHVERSLSASAKEITSQTFRIATFAYSAYRWLPEFLRIEKEKRKNLEFEFVATTPGKPIQSIEAGEADLGIVAGNIESLQVNVTELFQDELVCICPKGHRLSSKEHLIADDFMNDPFFTYSAYGESGFEEDQLWRRSGKRPMRMLNTGHTDAAIELVRAGFGLAILSRWAVANSPYSDELKLIRVTESGMPLTWSAAYRKSHPENDTLHAISQALRSWCKNANIAEVSGDTPLL